MKTRLHGICSKGYSRGFTLIELLTVIAIIAILAGILIPAVGAAKTAANKAKTKGQFNQWAVAMNLFKQEYGYYPAIDSGNKLVSASFFGALVGKDYLGATPTDYKGNLKHLSFYSASDSEVSLIANGDLVNGSLKDAFGNTDIAMFYDKDGDGMIKAAAPELLSAVTVTPVGGTALTPATGKIDTTNGIRAGVIFYSAGKGTSNLDIIYSWQ